MRIVLYAAFLLAAFRWGDWKNWRKYYPTFLFWMGGDLFYNALLKNHRIWHFRKGLIGNDILHGHLIITLLLIMLVYSSTILIYLGNFPRQRPKQILWVLFWVIIFSTIEIISNNYFHWIDYNYGWNIYWSIFFNLVMFPVLKIHYGHPLLAWIISILVFFLLYNIFNIPRESFN